MTEGMMTPVLVQMTKRNPIMRFQVEEAFLKFNQVNYRRFNYEQANYGLSPDDFDTIYEYQAELERNCFARKHRCDRVKARYRTKSGDIVISERYFHGQGETLAALAYEEQMTQEALDSFLFYEAEFCSQLIPESVKTLPLDNPLRGLFRAGFRLCYPIRSNSIPYHPGEFFTQARHSYQKVDAWRRKYNLTLMI